MTSLLKKIPKIVPVLVSKDYQVASTAYDKEADVLYVNFVEPAHTDDSELTDDDMVLHYNKKRELVGVTVLHASERK